VRKSSSYDFSDLSARVEERIRCYFGNQLIPEPSSCKYFGIIIRSDLNWADSVNYTLRKALHFIMRILKNLSNSTTRLADTALVR
jgi:hypothetical protein